ncbi:MAG: hypothetical protein RML74_06530 [Acidobacteriota bacterium]|nr:hypothetical protein [Acidobacteriota bacterium]
MKKLATMVLALTSVLGFSLTVMLPSALAIGFLIEAAGVTAITKFIAALIGLGFLFFTLNPVIA